MSLSSVSVVERSIHGLGYDITLHEQRLIYLALYKSRMLGTSLSGKIEIFSKEYSDKFGTSARSTVSAMESVILNKWATNVEFLTNVEKISFVFTAKGLAFVNVLNEKLTDENLENIMLLTNRQAIRVYELMYVWFDGEIPFLNLSQFRKLTGLICTNKGVKPYSFKSTLNTAIDDIYNKTKSMFEVRQEKFQDSKEICFSVVCV